MMIREFPIYKYCSGGNTTIAFATLGNVWRCAFISVCVTLMNDEENTNSGGREVCHFPYSMLAGNVQKKCMGAYCCR